MTPLKTLLSDIRACRLCEAELSHGPRPVLRASATARICIVGQAPGIRVHNTGIPFNDPSGDRLREWMGVDRDTFYDERRIAIVPMGFCFPGYTKAGADKPQRRQCARAWRTQLFEALPAFDLTLVIGRYAMDWHLGQTAKPSATGKQGRIPCVRKVAPHNVGETVHAWRAYAPSIIPLPHPSWRNNAWLKKNPWFERELLPDLRARVAALLSSR